MTRKKSPPVSWPGSVSSTLQRYLSKTQTRPRRSPAENPLMVRKLKLLGQQHMGEGSSESTLAHFPHPVDQIRSWFPPRARLALEAFPCLCTSHVRTPASHPLTPQVSVCDPLGLFVASCMTPSQHLAHGAELVPLPPFCTGEMRLRGSEPHPWPPKSFRLVSILFNCFVFKS